MNSNMEISRRTWIAAIKLATVISAVAALIAIGASSIGEVSAFALIIPVVVVAFAASWVQTGRVQRMYVAQSITIRRH